MILSILAIIEENFADVSSEGGSLPPTNTHFFSKQTFFFDSHVGNWILKELPLPTPLGAY